MRIGEIAELVGVTRRAVRHYHHVGLLPEPDRRPNGYRRYTARHAVLLARIRRLTELGLSLDEVRTVLADDAGRALTEILAELDADLARQEELIKERRKRLAHLLADAEAGRLPVDGPVSAEMAGLLTGLDELTASSPTAALDRELLVLLDTAASPEIREQLVTSVRAMTDTPGAAELARDLYARLDALADVEPDDDRVVEVGIALAATIPDEAAAPFSADVPIDEGAFAQAFFGSFKPAQAAAVRHAITVLQGRSR